MKIKKICAAAMGAVMAVNAAAVRADEELPSGVDISVKATYKGTEPETVKSFDIIWGKMEFVCTEKGVNRWDESACDYSFETDYIWTGEGTGVKVTNHSNVDAEVEFSFTPDEKYPRLSGKLSTEKAVLEKGKIGEPENADFAESFLTLNGVPDGLQADFSQVGKVTVKIS